MFNPHRFNVAITITITITTLFLALRQLSSSIQHAVLQAFMLAFPKLLLSEI